MKISFRMDKHDWEEMKELLVKYYDIDYEKDDYIDYGEDYEDYLRSEERIADEKALHNRITSKIDDIGRKYGYYGHQDFKDFIDDFEEMCKIENERRKILYNILELYSGSEISIERMSKMLKLDYEEELEEWLVYFPERIPFRKDGSSILIPKILEE